MSGTSGKAARSERDDGMSTRVTIPSQQSAYDAPTISRVMSEQRGHGYLETSTSHRDRYERPHCDPPHVDADGPRAAQAVVTAQELLREPEGLDASPYRPAEAREGLMDCFIMKKIFACSGGDACWHGKCPADMIPPPL
jgi:hypothetical protein